MFLIGYADQRSVLQAKAPQESHWRGVSDFSGEWTLSIAFVINAEELHRCDERLPPGT